MSAQTVRVYEEVGFLPPAERRPTGHRRYGMRHLQAMEVARAARAGYGWNHALQVIRLVHQGNLAAALEAVDARHAELHERRRQVDETLDALRVALTADDSAGRRSKPWERQQLHIQEVARMIGVRVSAVRYWEEQGLLRPERDPENGYRLYDAEQVRRLRVTALLRQAGYNFERIASVLEELGEGRPASALAAIERRRAELADESRRCMAATAALWGYIEESAPQTIPGSASSSPPGDRAEAGRP